MKKVLMVAYHFPPHAGSSGIQRTLRFVQYLPSLGWQPLVLTVKQHAYEETSLDLLADIPPDTVVRRAFAIDSARHLQIGGRYARWTARPDRWVSWKFDGIRQGMDLVNEFKPDVLWSTYPIATAHLIAAVIHRKTGIPWVADFRDPMAQVSYPRDMATRLQFLNIEANAAANARFCVFTTPGAAALYQSRYPSAASRMVILENGYDEESFTSKPPQASPSVDLQTSVGQSRPLMLLHSGIVYPSERNPTHLLEALGRVKSDGKLTAKQLRIRFRGTGHDAMLENLAKQHNVADLVEICPPLPYRAALAEMLATDVLLILQGSGCNAQIPAKIYEYLRAGRPILGLTDPKGDTAGVLKQAGLNNIAQLNSVDAIARSLLSLVSDWGVKRLELPDPAAVKNASRYARSESLARLLSSATLSESLNV